MSSGSEKKNSFELGFCDKSPTLIIRSGLITPTTSRVVAMLMTIGEKEDFPSVYWGYLDVA